jgi:hypothetical protein
MHRNLGPRSVNRRGLILTKNGLRNAPAAQGCVVTWEAGEWDSLPKPRMAQTAAPRHLTRLCGTG